MQVLRRFLVLCSANRCRSQVAEGWLRHFSCGRFEIFSAGIDPKGVHPLAVQVMAERGVDLSGYTSNRIEQFVDQPFDVVITVCNQAQEACPTFPLAHRVIRRAFEDPDQSTLAVQERAAVFRRIRDEIHDWAFRFVEVEVGPKGAPVYGPHGCVC